MKKNLAILSLGLMAMMMIGCGNNTDTVIENVDDTIIVNEVVDNTSEDVIIENISEDVVIEEDITEEIIIDTEDTEEVIDTEDTEEVIDEEITEEVVEPILTLDNLIDITPIDIVPNKDTYIYDEYGNKRKSVITLTNCGNTVASKISTDGIWYCLYYTEDWKSFAKVEDWDKKVVASTTPTVPIVNPNDYVLWTWTTIPHSYYGNYETQTGIDMGYYFLCDTTDAFTAHRSYWLNPSELLLQYGFGGAMESKLVGKTEDGQYLWVTILY